MDGDDVTQQQFADCMKDLARVNMLTLARRPTLAFISRALDVSPPGQPLTIVDVGYGAGDMLRAIAGFLVKRGRAARLVGFDINPRSQPVAEAMTPPGMAIDFRTGDAMDWPDHEPLDIVISSLVTHHMDDAQIMRFLRWMEDRAALGWLVNDLHRNWFAYHGFRMLSTAMRWHPFVRHDGPLSILRAFRREEWAALLQAADMPPSARVEWWFPFRYCVERRKW